MVELASFALSVGSNAATFSFLPAATRARLLEEATNQVEEALTEKCYVEVVIDRFGQCAGETSTIQANIVVALDCASHGCSVASQMRMAEFVSIVSV